MDERTQRAMNPSVAAKLTVSQLETALKALAKLFGAIKFYPPGHPALKDVTDDARSAFAPLLQGRESLVLVVRRNGFYYEDEAVGSTNTMLQKLASSLFIRRIQRLLILQDLSSRDLWETANILLLDADVIQKQGGGQALLLQGKVTTIWANVVDIDSIFEVKERIEAENSSFSGSRAEAVEEASCAPPADAPVPEADVTILPAATAEAATEELPFEELLERVEEASGGPDFSGLLQRLIPVVQANLNEGSAHLVLRTLAFLTHCCERGSDREGGAREAREALTQLASPPLLSFYVDLLSARLRLETDLMRWDKISRALGAPLAQLLLARFAVAEDSTARKVLFDALVSQGDVALPAIIATIQDDRWPVLRNAAQLLGEIRSQAAIEPLRPLLRHRDLRVRREVLRALTRIGGKTVIAIIAKILYGNDNELRRQAMLGLGAIKDPTTIPLLVQFLMGRDWRFLQLEAKIDAVRALGEIGSAEALPVLTEIAGHRSFFYRSRNDLLRAAALMAIGEIGGSDSTRFLESLNDESSAIVAKARTSALKQVRKEKVGA